MIAAHIFGVSEDRALREGVGVLNAYDTHNGMLLTKPLHDAFDAYRWCICPENASVVVADDYKNDEHLINVDGKRVAFWNKLGTTSYPTQAMIEKRWVIFCRMVERRLENSTKKTRKRIKKKSARKN